MYTSYPKACAHLNPDLFAYLNTAVRSRASCTSFTFRNTLATHWKQASNTLEQSVNVRRVHHLHYTDYTVRSSESVVKERREGLEQFLNYLVKVFDPSVWREREGGRGGREGREGWMEGGREGRERERGRERENET
jgi:hypothetical protein